MLFVVQDEEHEEHVCDQSASCEVTCDIMRRCQEQQLHQSCCHHQLLTRIVKQDVTSHNCTAVSAHCCGCQQQSAGSSSQQQSLAIAGQVARAALLAADAAFDGAWARHEAA